MSIHTPLPCLSTHPFSRESSWLSGFDFHRRVFSLGSKLTRRRKFLSSNFYAQRYTLGRMTMESMRNVLGHLLGHLLIRLHCARYTARHSLLYSRTSLCSLACLLAHSHTLSSPWKKVFVHEMNVNFPQLQPFEQRWRSTSLRRELFWSNLFLFVSF